MSFAREFCFIFVGLRKFFGSIFLLKAQSSLFMLSDVWLIGVNCAVDFI